MKTLFVMTTLLLAACGSSPAPSAPVAPAGSAAQPADVPSGRTVRVVRIDTTQLESIAKTDLATAKKWGSDPANAKYVLPTFRHILVKAGKGNTEAREAARRKADDLLARLDRGEDFATLAKTSDDPGSASNGGAYPGRMVKSFVTEVRDAYDALRPGERAKTPVETSFGWHVIAKGPIDDEACLDGHRGWLARTAAERIGRDLTKRLRKVDAGSPAAEVERAFAAVLGDDQRKIESLPTIVRMSAETCDGFATIARGEGITWRGGNVVAAALTNDERDAAESEAEGCDEYPAGQMTPARLQELIERARKR